MQNIQRKKGLEWFTVSRLWGWNAKKPSLGLCSFNESIIATKHR
jgi:hypothetical protein